MTIKRIRQWYNETFEVWRLNETGSGFGGVQGEFQKALTIQGRLRPQTGRESVTGDKMTLYGTHTLYTDVADIKESDRVVDVYGNEYNVKFVPNMMRMNNHLQIALELVR